MESVYEEAFIFELRKLNLAVERQVKTPIIYKGKTLASPLRIDLLVNSKVVVECKAVSELNDIVYAQTLTYLRLKNLRLGLVINFGEKLVKNGLRRVVNNLT